MRVPFPTSRGAFRFRFRPFDVVLAVVSPVLALYLSNAYVVTSALGVEDLAIYSAISVFVSVLAFLVFRTEDSLLYHFSVHDAIKVSKAVVTAELATCVIAFTITRLEGIPRSTPIIHALTLLTGLIFVRIFASIASKDVNDPTSSDTSPEYIILISSSSLSALYIKLLHARDSGKRRVVSVLNDRPRMVGRAIEEVPIVGTPDHLEAVIEEYRVHGIQIDRVVFGEERRNLSEEVVKMATLVCEREQICLDFLPQILALQELKSKPQYNVSDPVADVVLPAYFFWKQAIDIMIAAVLIVVLLPLFVGTALIVLIDVGSPVLFWQRRLGAHGRWFLLYKFRTLSAPLNGRGELVQDRLSRIGQLLRDTSLDELPQLFNVLVGDMSLIGPRPLLPVDQPKDARIRLMVPPGITGWAQVNGRKSLTPEEKEQLDAWYVRNGSLRVDALIVFKTLRLLLNGMTGSNKDSKVAENLRSASTESWRELRSDKLEQT